MRRLVPAGLMRLRSAPRAPVAVPLWRTCSAATGGDEGSPAQTDDAATAGWDGATPLSADAAREAAAAAAAAAAVDGAAAATFFCRQCELHVPLADQHRHVMTTAHMAATMLQAVVEASDGAALPVAPKGKPPLEPWEVWCAVCELPVRVGASRAIPSKCVWMWRVHTERNFTHNRLAFRKKHGRDQVHTDGFSAKGAAPKRSAAPKLKVG